MPHVPRCYLLSLVFFTLGLMSKPMVVTLPFVLLLLDFWPLRRFQFPALNQQPSTPVYQASTVTGLLREKVPFFALSAVSCVMTLLLQKGSRAPVMIAGLSWGEQVENALVSYLRYLGKLFWPADLAVIYPHPASRYYTGDQWPGWEICAGSLLLLAVSALCLCQLRRRPYLAVGWFWFLGMLVPVIGLIQVGEQAMADRYTYLPLIGPVLSLVWLLGELASHRTEQTCQRAVGQPPDAVDGCLGATRRQGTGAVQAHSGAPATCSGASVSAGQWALAAMAVIVIAVCCVLTHRQLGYWRNSIALFEHTVEVTPDNPSAQFALGVGFEKEQQVGRAMVCYRAATAICASYADAHYNLGQLLRKQGACSEAAKEYRAALRANPRCLPACLNLGAILLESGETRKAVQEFQEFVTVAPDSADALNNLAWLLAASSDATIRNGARAVEYGERACRLTGFKQTLVVGTLAAAYAEAGRFDDAAATAEKACALAAQDGEQELLEKNRQLLELYRAGKPFHEPLSPGTQDRSDNQLRRPNTQ